MSFATATHPFAVRSPDHHAVRTAPIITPHCSRSALDGAIQAHDRIHAFGAGVPILESALMYAAVQGRYWLFNPRQWRNP